MPRDFQVLILLAVAGGVLLLTGLSVRSLWGSEGRWAVIAREMLASGNWFLPTINGEVYFDKPLLSYWIISAFALTGGVSEAAARLPSALAGAGCVLLMFAMGRRLFGARCGLLAGGLLLTSAMFILWSRTASAEMLNLLSIWLMLWAFIAGGVDGKLRYLLFLYGIGTISAFLKGPVAPAVSFFVIGFYSLARALTPLRTQKQSWLKVRDLFLSHFRWVLSWQGLVSIIAALSIFALLLLMPVLVTGSWQSVALMWRENVLRFFRPFDHVEPPWTYLKHAPVFFMPWTLLLIASLWESRRWPANWASRWTWLTGLAIFLFFTASGSRRSYYILPLVPALALITGKALSDWLTRPDSQESRIMTAAALATSVLPGLVGMGLTFAYFSKSLPHHPVQLMVAIPAIIGSVVTLALFLKGRKRPGLVLLFLLFFALELWAFTGGMAMAERMRTFRPFCEAAAERLEGVEDKSIALYPGGDSSLTFYLNRRVRYLNSPGEVAKFRQERPGGFLIADVNSIEDLRGKPGLEGMAMILAQSKEWRGKKDNQLLLMKLPGETAHGDGR